MFWETFVFGTINVTYLLDDGRGAFFCNFPCWREKPSLPDAFEYETKFMIEDFWKIFSAKGEVD